MKLMKLIVREKEKSFPTQQYTGTSIIRQRHKARMEDIADMRALHPPRSNLLARAISRLNKKSDIYDLNDVFHHHGFCMNDVTGKVLYNIFHRAPVKEIILVDTIDNTGDIIEVIYYPFSGTVPPTPNGREFDYPEDSFVIYRINGYKLLEQYKRYLNSIPSGGTHNNRWFIYNNLMLPLLNKLVDISVLNSYLSSIDEDFAVKCVENPDRSYLKEYNYLERLITHTKYMALKNRGNDGLAAVLDTFDLPFGRGFVTSTFINSKVNPRYNWVNMLVMQRYAKFFTKLNAITRVPWLIQDITLLKLKARAYAPNSSSSNYIPKGIRSQIVTLIQKINSKGK